MAGEMCGGCDDTSFPAHHALRQAVIVAKAYIDATSCADDGSTMHRGYAPSL